MIKNLIEIAYFVEIKKILTKEVNDKSIPKGELPEEI